MAVLDFGKNRLTITVSGTTASNHAPVAGGMFRRQRGALYSNPLALQPREIAAGNGFSITLVGTALLATHAPGKLDFGMPGAGRLYASNYVPPVATWKPITIALL